MSDDDRRRWDERHKRRLDSGRDWFVQAADGSADHPPGFFALLPDHFPTSGTAIDVACGLGAGALWLAHRGLTVIGWDVSPVAVEAANAAAARAGLSDRCRFEVADLDGGLPPGPAADVILCTCFRAPDLYPEFVARLNPGGVLAIATLSEVGDEPGDYRATPGELNESFAALEILESNEGDGVTVLVGRRPRS